MKLGHTKTCGYDTLKRVYKYSEQYYLSRYCPIQKKKKMVYDRIHLTFLIIPTGPFFGYQSTPNGISISKNEPVSALRTEIWNNYLTEYGNASFNLRAVDIERREYVYMEPEKKISDYFNPKPSGISIHILVEAND
ncbi:hypothetical protein Glove_661g61 [Diversispora epigaea]|uniref:Uncharacterized protein n=1 Tax=Diversispora epigaea TaxID=1348612 RepID=A0A397G769_9GLOM|nr:hypothetical protein Glove_661g61 [Diversispora epigaea]